MRAFIGLFFLLSTFSFPAAAEEVADTGKQLFHSTALGSNGKSCHSCHPDGKGLERSDEYDSVMLREIINFCIRDALKGEMLPLDSPELKELEAHVMALQKTAR